MLYCYYGYSILGMREASVDSGKKFIALVLSTICNADVYPEDVSLYIKNLDSSSLLMPLVLLIIVLYSWFVYKIYDS